LEWFDEWNIAFADIGHTVAELITQYRKWGNADEYKAALRGMAGKRQINERAVSGISNNNAKTVNLVL
tara:strand:+ start:59 stop:262 length:204 start_codon:yes stop_codon:yes gene_type:complete